VPDKFKNGKTQDSPLDSVYSAEAKENVMRFFLLLEQIPLGENHAEEARVSNDLSQADES
jgi:hypothetical protein